MGFTRALALNPLRSRWRALLFVALFAATAMGSSTGNLPDGWKECKAKNGQTFFVNHFTKTSTWERPIKVTFTGKPYSDEGTCHVTKGSDTINYRFMNTGRGGSQPPKVWEQKANDFFRICAGKPWYFSHKTGNYIHYDEVSMGWWIKNRDDNCLYFAKTPASLRNVERDSNFKYKWIPASSVTATHGFPLPQPLQERMMPLPRPAPEAEFPAEITTKFTKASSRNPYNIINVLAPGCDFAGVYQYVDQGNSKPRGRGKL